MSKSSRWELHLSRRTTFDALNLCVAKLPLDGRHTSRCQDQTRFWGIPWGPLLHTSGQFVHPWHFCLSGPGMGSENLPV